MKVFNFFFNIKKIKNELNLFGWQFIFHSREETARKLLTGKYSISKLSNPLLKSIVGNESVITSYTRSEHKNSRTVAKKALYNLKTFEINLIDDIIRNKLSKAYETGFIDGNLFPHELAFEISSNIFIGEFSNSSKLSKKLRSFQANVPYGIILFSRIFANGLFAKILKPIFHRKKSIEKTLQIILYSEETIKSERLVFIENLLLKEGKNHQITSHLSGILLAAHETLTCSIGWLLCELGTQPKLQQKLRNSLKSNEDNYITRFVDDLLKKYPPLWLLVRDTTENKIEIVNVETINGCPFSKTSFTFGMGKRYCLGVSFAKIELKMLLKAILENFEIVCDKQQIVTQRSNLLRPYFKSKIKIWRI